MEYTIAAAAGCAVLAFFIGRLSAAAVKFDPFTYYRTRIRQITDSAEKQTDLQARIQSFDKAWSEIFDNNK